jgi:hypothetical protein
MRALKGFFAGNNVPTTFKLMLATSATAPTKATNTFSELTEITAGNGYTSGGISIARNLTDWDTATENDSDNTATLLLKDEIWTASGGTIPLSGSNAAYVVLTDDNVTIGSRDVLMYESIGSVSVSSGQPLTIADFGIKSTQS